MEQDSELNKGFEKIMKVSKKGTQYWEARELMPRFGYKTWESFNRVINKAKISCFNSGNTVFDHFRDVTKVIPTGKGAQLRVSEVLLDRYACYLVAQNGTSSKKEIAAAQSYFAMQTRRQEVLEQRLNEDKRLEERNRLMGVENTIRSTVYQRGVKQPVEFATFKDAHIKALYNGKSTKELKQQYPELLENLDEVKNLPLILPITFYEKKIFDFYELKDDRYFRKKIKEADKPKIAELFANKKFCIYGEGVCLILINESNDPIPETISRLFSASQSVMFFEMYDNNSENKRSVFGGGRYDDLLSIFGGDKVPAFGFGAGDVIIRDILETYKLLPEYKPKTALYICTLGKEFQEYGNELAQKLREQGVNVAVDLTNKKVGDQIKSADKQKIPFIICLGEDEIKSGQFKLKNLKTGEEQTVTEQGLSLALKGETLFSQKNA